MIANVLLKKHIQIIIGMFKKVSLCLWKINWKWNTFNKYKSTIVFTNGEFRPRVTLLTL